MLDDITRARVAAVIAAATRAPARVPLPMYRRRWVIGAAAAAAAVLAIGLFLRGRELDALRTSAPVIPMFVLGELPEGTMLSAVPGTAVHGQIAGAVLTVYGPGWATRRGPRIVVDADRLVVDRPGGDAPVELKVRTATIRVQHATFSVDSSYAVRVTVIRGEILLVCADDDANQSVTAGGSASCGRARTAAGRPGPTVAPSPGPLPTDTSSEQPGAVLADTSSGSPQATSPDAPSPSPAQQPTTASAPSPPPHTTTDGASPTRHATAATASSQTWHATSGAPSPTPRATTAGAPSPTPSANTAGARPTSPEPATAGVPPGAPGEPTARSIAALESPTVRADTAARYAAVKRLMAREPDAARAALRALVAEAPTAPEAAPALLDLARLAAAVGDVVAAQAALDQLAAHPDAASLAMPAMYLRCSLEETDPGGRACLAGFRAAFPDSPRDADVLARLAIATARAGDCQAAVPMLVEFRQRYANAPSDADVRAWTARCDHATTLR